jgi:hypothetical protein
MKIRDFTDADAAFVADIHRVNGLDARCMPELGNPLFLVRRVLEHEGQPAMVYLLKGTLEIYFFVDHAQGTPEERWEWLQRFAEDARQQGFEKGVDALTCWVPSEVERSFEKRLLELGFLKSPWQSYTLPLV